MDVNVNSRDFEIDLELFATGCGADIPEMTIIPEDGVTLQVTERDAFDEVGNMVKATQYKMTNSEHKIVTIQIHEHVKISPGIIGTFKFDYRGIKARI